MKNKENKRHKYNDDRNRSASFDKTQRKSNLSSIIFESGRNSMCSPRQTKNSLDKYNNYMQFISSGKFVQSQHNSKQNIHINRAKASTPTPRRLSASLLEQGRKSVMAKQHQLRDVPRNSKLEENSSKTKNKPLFIKGNNIIKPNKNRQQLKTKDSQDHCRPVSNKRKPQLKVDDAKISTKTDNKIDEKQKKLIVKLFANIQFHRDLGRGAHALVKSGVDFANKRKIAVKIYEKNQLSTDQIRSIQNEVQILGSLNHPTVIKLYQIIETLKTINLVMEYGGGNSLEQYIKNKPKGRLEQVQAREIFKSIVKAISYLHEKGVAHRDIKTDNILLNKHLEVKLIDFGFSQKMDKKDLSTIYCGTPTYMAPEIVSKTPHSPFLADRWALGILLYYMLQGHSPFKVQNQRQLFQKICKGEVIFQFQISAQSKNLVLSLLSNKPELRPNIQHILAHQWMAI